LTRSCCKTEKLKRRYFGCALGHSSQTPAEKICALRNKKKLACDPLSFLDEISLSLTRNCYSTDKLKRRYIGCVLELLSQTPTKKNIVECIFLTHYARNKVGVRLVVLDHHELVCLRKLIFTCCVRAGVVRNSR